MPECEFLVRRAAGVAISFDVPRLAGAGERPLAATAGEDVGVVGEPGLRLNDLERQVLSSPESPKPAPVSGDYPAGGRQGAETIEEREKKKSERAKRGIRVNKRGIRVKSQHST